MIPENVNPKEVIVQESKFSGYPDYSQQQNFFDIHNEEVKLNSLVIESKLRVEDPAIQTNNIVRAFNEHLQGETFMIESEIYGDRIEPDEFRIVHYNNIPELVPYSPIPKRKIQLLSNFFSCCCNCGGIVQEVKKVKQNEPYFETHGIYVINVPRGHYALVRFGQTSRLLEFGPHVINTANINFSLSTTGPANQKQPLFIPLATPHINHGSIHVLRVPKGQLAKVWFNTEPQLLPSRTQPYVFDNPLFKVDGFVDVASEYIKHGTIHILRVPQGKMAKVWEGQVPKLLEARDELYEFNSPIFKLVPKAIYNVQGKKVSEENFEDASDKLITHGAIKRLLPRTNEVAVTYRDGHLQIFTPSDKNEPTLITSPTHIVDGFIRTDIQTLVFPSTDTKEKRRIEEKTTDLDYINYEVFRTKDGLPIGVKLLVAYQIINPLTVLQNLQQSQIIPHIENIVVADMGNVIQRCSSGDFQATDQTKAMIYHDASTLPNQPSAPFIGRLQDEVKNQLCKDLRLYGIELIRLNTETPKVLDRDVAQRMSQNALKISEIGAQEAVLEQQFKIAKTQAEQEAKKQEIEQNQKSRNIITTVETEKQAAEMKAQAVEIEAKGKSAAKIIAADAEAKAIQMKYNVELEYMQSLANLVKDNPELARLKFAEVQAKTLSNIQTAIVSPTEAAALFAFQGGLFSLDKSQRKQSSEEKYPAVTSKNAVQKLL